MEQKEVAFAIQQCINHLSAAKNKHATVEELLGVMFSVWSVLMLYNEDQVDKEWSLPCKKIFGIMKFIISSLGHLQIKLNIWDVQMRIQLQVLRPLTSPSYFQKSTYCPFQITMSEIWKILIGLKWCLDTQNFYSVGKFSVTKIWLLLGVSEWYTWTVLYMCVCIYDIWITYKESLWIFMWNQQWFPCIEDILFVCCYDVLHLLWSFF